MSTTIVGFPRIGENRELKFQTEKYFRNEITESQLLSFAEELTQASIGSRFHVVSSSGLISPLT